MRKAQVYFQITIKPRQNVVHNDLYNFKRMPQGFKNLGSIFQQINNLFFYIIYLMIFYKNKMD